MIGVWLEDHALQVRHDLACPEPKEDEALIRVLMAGICGTDLELVKGYYPFSGIPGHEFVGEVVSTVKNSDIVGKRVVADINICCGYCDQCLNKQSKHCRNRTVLGIKNKHGAFAEYLTLPIDNLHHVPDSISNEKAVFAEPVAAAAQILEQIRITATDSVLIIGAGRLGQLIAQVIKTTHCQLQVVTRHLSQSEMLSNIGIKSIVESEILSNQTDIIIEATGSASGLSAALMAVKPKGTIILKSTYKDLPRTDINKLVVNEIKLIGSRCGSLEIGLRHLGDEVDPTPLIEKSYPLANALDAMEQASTPGTFKILLTP